MKWFYFAMTIVATVFFIWAYAEDDLLKTVFWGVIVLLETIAWKVEELKECRK